MISLQKLPEDKIELLKDLTEEITGIVGIGAVAGVAIAAFGTGAAAAAPGIIAFGGAVALVGAGVGLAALGIGEMAKGMGGLLGVADGEDVTALASGMLKLAGASALMINPYSMIGLAKMSSSI